MIKTLPLEGDIVKCTKDYIEEAGEDKYRNPAKFIKGDLYVVRHSQQVYVTLADNIESYNRKNFVADPNVYLGIPFFEHFKAHKKANECMLYSHSYNHKGYNDYKEKVESESKYSDRNFKLNGNSESFNFTKLVSLKTYEYLKEIKFEKGWASRGESLNDKLDDSNLKLADELESIVIHNTHERISSYDRDKKIREEDNILFNLKKFPNNLKNIEFVNVKAKNIKASLESISLTYSEVENLVLNPKTLKNVNLQDIKIGKCNLEYFIDRTNGCGSELFTFKLDEDTFVSTFSNGRLTRNEMSQVCSTLQLKETIKHFELDNVQFNYDSCLKGEERGRYSIANTFSFSEGSKIHINLFKDEIVLFSKHIAKQIDKYNNLNFSFTVDPDFNIKVYRARLESSLHVERNGKLIIKGEVSSRVLSNKYLNFLSKFSEHEQLPPAFFTELFTHPTVAKAKNTGVINISEFTFDSFRNTIYENCIAIKYFDKKWYWYGEPLKKEESKNQYDRNGYDIDGFDKEGFDSRGTHKEDYGRDYEDEDENSVPSLEEIAYPNKGKKIIEWANLGFEIDSKDIKHNSMYAKPGVKDYYANLGHARDEYFYLHNEIEFPKYDEDKEYNVKLNEDDLHSEDYMVLDTGIFFNQNMEEFYNQSRSRRARDHFNGGPRSHSIGLETAELLAKKYNFKLIPDRIQGGEKNTRLSYIHIGRICSGEDFQDTSLNYVIRYGLENSVLLNQKDLVRKDKPFIRIGDKIYHHNHYNSHSRVSIDIVGDLEEYTHKEEVKYKSKTAEIQKLLKENDLNFSYVNIDIPAKLKTDVMRFVGKHYNDLYHAYQHAYNQMLPFMFYRIAYVNNTFEDCLEYKHNREEQVKVTKKTEDEFQVLKSELKTCFENTLKRIKKTYG